MGIQQRLEQAIRESGIPQAELARRMGKSPSWLSKRLVGPVPLRADELPLFAKAMRVDVCDLTCALLGEKRPETSVPLPHVTQADDDPERLAEVARIEQDILDGLNALPVPEREFAFRVLAAAEQFRERIIREEHEASG